MGRLLLLFALSALNVAEHDNGYDNDSPPQPSLRPTLSTPPQPAPQPTLRRWRRPKRRLSGDDGDDDGGGGDDDDDDSGGSQSGGGQDDDDSGGGSQSGGSEDDDDGAGVLPRKPPHAQHWRLAVKSSSSKYPQYDG